MPISPGTQLQVTLDREVTMDRWYPPGRFFQRDIEKDHPWQILPECAKKMLRQYGWDSWLSRNSPIRRYVKTTNRQMARKTGYSERWVRHCKGLLKKGRFIVEHYPGDSGTTTTFGRPRPPVIEIPASRKAIIYLRINLKSKGRPRA